MTTPMIPGKLIVETSRLRLRELAEIDAAFIMELVNEPGWLRFIGDRHVHTHEDARGYIARGPAASYAKHGYGLWAVDTLGVPAGGGPSEPVGMCGLIRRDSLPHPDLGFAFLARHHGKGYAREASAAVVELARDRFRLGRLLAITEPDNDASRRVLEHVGFRFENRFTWAETGSEQSLFAHELA